MIDKKSLIAAAEKLKTLHDAKIYYHKEPDGDAIGSAYALAMALQSEEVRCELLCEDPVPERYYFLTDSFNNDKVEKAVNIVLDSSAPYRLGRYSDTKFDICIDHHENNIITAECKLVDETRSSCAEIIYMLLLEMGISITKQIADLLYAGLATDTYCFRMPNTNSDSLRTAAELAGYGAGISVIGQRLCMKKSRACVMIERVLLNNYHYSCNGKVLGSYFTYEDLQRADTTDADLEGINTIVDQVDGIDIGIVVREKKPGICRVSIRTYGLYDASEICKKLGGGGHAERAGCTIEGNPEEVLHFVEKVCVDVFRDNKKCK